MNIQVHITLLLIRGWSYLELQSRHKGRKTANAEGVSHYQPLSGGAAGRSSEHRQIYTSVKRIV